MLFAVLLVLGVVSVEPMIVRMHDGYDGYGYGGMVKSYKSASGSSSKSAASSSSKKLAMYAQGPNGMHRMEQESAAKSSSDQKSSFSQSQSFEGAHHPGWGYGGGYSTGYGRMGYIPAARMYKSMQASSSKKSSASSRNSFKSQQLLMG